MSSFHLDWYFMFCPPGYRILVFVYTFRFPSHFLSRLPSTSEYPPPFSPLSGGFVKRVTGIVSDYPRTLQKREGSNATITSLVADIDAATDHVHLASALPIGNPMLRLLKGRIDLRNHPKIVVVAVENQNSGVGKMALSFNLSQIHAGRKGTKVLTIDNDPQGNLASSCIILNVWQK